MSENLDEAKEELKRADHLIYVSLKYTRTCDVLKHIIDRLINCIDFCFTALLEDLVEKNKIESVPKAPIAKANLIKELFPNDAMLVEFADRFVRFRKISKADFSRACEFRRHVTMTVEVEGEKLEINIDNITEDYHKSKEFFTYIEKLVGVEVI
jgi:hypothetical protein